MQDKYFPYTFDWHSLAALSVACDNLLGEGVQESIKRHRTVTEYCRNRLKGMGIALYIEEDESASSTITAAYVPLKGEQGGKGWDSWETFDRELRKKGVVVGGSYGSVKGKVFRIGHMGSQADLALVTKVLDIIEGLLEESTH